MGFFDPFGISWEIRTDRGQGVDDIFQRQRRRVREIRAGIEQAINQALLITQQRANNILYSKLVGGSKSRPHDSIAQHWNIIPSKREGSKYIGILYNTSPHADFVEYGTARYRDPNAPTKATDYFIRPKDSEYLWYEIDGKLRRSVFVEGQHPKAFLRNAKFQMERDFPGLLLRKIRANLR